MNFLLTKLTKKIINAPWKHNLYHEMFCINGDNKNVEYKKRTDQ